MIIWMVTYSVQHEKRRTTHTRAFTHRAHAKEWVDELIRSHRAKELKLVATPVIVRLAANLKEPGGRGVLSLCVEAAKVGIEAAKEHM